MKLRWFISHSHSSRQRHQKHLRESHFWHQLLGVFNKSVERNSYTDVKSNKSFLGIVEFAPITYLNFSIISGVVLFGRTLPSFRATDPFSWKFLKKRWKKFCRYLTNWSRELENDNPVDVIYFDCIKLEHFAVKVLSGVPQRTVLGPLVFIVYIAHLAELCSPSALFTDDLKLYNIAKNNSV